MRKANHGKDSLISLFLHFIKNDLIIRAILKHLLALHALILYKIGINVHLAYQYLT